MTNPRELLLFLPIMKALHLFFKALQKELKVCCLIHFTIFWSTFSSVYFKQRVKNGWANNIHQNNLRTPLRYWSLDKVKIAFFPGSIWVSVKSENAGWEESMNNIESFKWKYGFIHYHRFSFSSLFFKVRTLYLSGAFYIDCNA